MEFSIRFIAAVSLTGLLVTVMSACSWGAVNSSDALESLNTGFTGKQTVKVSVFTEDRFLKEAVAEFEQAHPDIDIQVQETVATDTSNKRTRMVNGLNGADDGIAQEDIDKYVKTVGTALMAGNASDLIALNYLAVDRYLNKGMFADWSELAGQDENFRSEEYYERILTGMSDDRGWYAIPISFSINVMLGNKEAFDKLEDVDDNTWDWNRFMEVCRQLASQDSADGKGMQVLGGMKPEDLLGYVVESVYEKLVTKDGSRLVFDEETFGSYMEQVKQLYDSGAASADSIGITNQILLPMSMAEPMELATLPSALGAGGEVLYPPGTGEDKGYPFASSLAFALNDRSEVKQAAWEFIKFLLDEKMQSSPSLSGFPVHQAAVKARLEQFAKLQKEGGATMMIQGKDGAARSLTITDEQIESVLQLLPSVGSYELSDRQVIGMIKADSAAYFSGNKSAESVANAVAGKINTYLNE